MATKSTEPNALPAPEPPSGAKDDPNALPPELRTSQRDWWVALGRAAAGAVPVAGGALSELLGLIPRLRQERVIEYLVALARRMDRLDRHFNQNNAFTVDLFEAAVLIAARAITPNRNQYLVNLMQEAEDVDKFQYEVDKKLLHVLAELTDRDIEVLEAHAKFEALVALERDWPRAKLLSSADRQRVDVKRKYSIAMVEVSLQVHREILLRFGLIEVKPPLKEIKELQGIHVYAERMHALPYEITTFGRLLLTRVRNQSFLK